jgi:hypothetical protein
MSKEGGRTALITSALVIAGIRMWAQLRGTAKTPFSEWAIGWGAMFFILSLVSEVAPGAAGMLSLIAAVSDFLQNGVSLTTDLSGLVTGASTGPVLVAQPFAATAAPAPASTTAPATAKVTTGS